MSSGPKACREEEKEIAREAHLTRLRNIPSEDLIRMHGLLDRALACFDSSDLKLTRLQWNAIDGVRAVKDSLR